MATKEQQLRLKKDPKEKPCQIGGHDEIIQRPAVPEGEEDPNERVNAMRRAGANQHEIDSALHNIQAEHITHGNQLSRGLTPDEAGQNGDSQKIFAICVVCRKKREVDQSPDASTAVEAKNERKMSQRQRDQARENAAFSRQPGNSATYKLPGAQARGGRARRIAQIFRDALARAPNIIPI